jgi:hypothetical protein
MRATCVYPWSSLQEVQDVTETIKPLHWVPQQGRCDLLEQSGASETSQFSSDLLQPEGHLIDDDIINGPALCPALAPLPDHSYGRRRNASFLAPDVQRHSTDKPCQDAGSSVPILQPPHNIDLSLVPHEEASNISVYKGKVFQARAEYAASRLAYQVRTFAATGQTSFIHHSQTEESGVLRDAFTACSMSITRNPANESLVLSEISRSAQTLIETTETTISLVPPSSHSVLDLDLLPYIQAMLIYQCIRLFATDDIVQHTQAELDAAWLARWIDILQEQTYSSWDKFSCSTQLDHSSWKDWVRAESIQRTIVFAELLDGIYTFLKTGWYQPSARLAQMSFTGQAAAWDTRSAAEWHKTRAQKPWIELRLSSFHEDIKAVFPSDLDELGIIILISYDGIDMVREWMGDDKRQLDQWGLTARSDTLSECR